MLYNLIFFITALHINISNISNYNQIIIIEIQANFILSKNHINLNVLHAIKKFIEKSLASM
jgi:hypothetical protein